MKICFIGYNFLPNYYEGIRKNTYQIAKRLSEKNFKVIIITIGDKDSEFFYNGVKIYSIAGGKNFFRFIAHIKRIIQDERPDVIHDRFILSGSSLITIMSTRGMKVCKVKTYFTEPMRLGDIFSSRNIMTLKSEIVPRIILDNFVSRAITLGFFDKILVSSKFLTDRLKGYKEKIMYIPEGVDYEHFAVQKRGNKKLIRKYFQKLDLRGKKIVCYLGHPAYKKGFTFLLDALPEILEEHKDLLFVFALSRVGETEKGYLGKIKTLAHKTGRVISLGIVDPAELFPLVDILILPIVYGWGAMAIPNTILEAMAAGMVVISTPTPGIKEVVKDKQNGLLTKKRSKQAIIEAINFCFANPSQLVKMRNKAKFTAQKFAWPKTINQYIEIYRDYGKKGKG